MVVNYISKKFKNYEDFLIRSNSLLETIIMALIFVGIVGASHLVSIMRDVDRFPGLWESIYFVSFLCSFFFFLFLNYLRYYKYRCRELNFLENGVMLIQNSEKIVKYQNLRRIIFSSFKFEVTIVYSKGKIGRVLIIYFYDLEEFNYFRRFLVNVLGEDIVTDCNSYLDYFNKI